MRTATLGLIRCLSAKSSLRNIGWYCVVGDVNNRNKRLSGYFLMERAEFLITFVEKR